MKFSLRVYALSCAFLVSATASGQDYTWHPRTSLSLSLNYSQLREMNRTSFPFSGPGVGGALARRIENDYYYQLIEVSAYAIMAKSPKASTTTAALATGSLTYHLMLNHAFGGDKVSVGVFAQASLKESFFTSKGTSTLYWANFGGAGAALAFEQPVSERCALEAVVDIPLIGVTFRPKAQGRTYPKNTFGYVIRSNTSNGDFGLPGNYLNPTIKLSILRPEGSFIRAVSYKYMHYEVKTAVSKQYWENFHSLIFTFGLGKSVRG